jgi:perosamine synthetase
MIPVYTPVLSGSEEDYVLRAISGLELSGSSKPVRVFEERFADYVGVRHAIAVSSGTAALETALYGVGVGEGDEVVLPSFTIISCAIAVLRVGATPVLVDVDPDTWCVDVTQVARAITDRTKAVMPVDMMGHPAPLPQFGDFKLVEDACQAHGAEAHDYAAGKLGHASAFSFYPNKLITTGEGGMVTTNDDDIAERARSYRNLCFGSGADRFVHTDLGYNFRMSGLQAALGCAQLEAIDDVLKCKRRVARMYRNRLAGVEGIRFQVEQPWAKSSHWMVGIVTGMLAVDVMAELALRGIGSRPFFRGLHGQPALFDRPSKRATAKFKYGSDTYRVTERLSRYGLILPSGPGLQDADIDYVCDAVKEVVGG